MISPSSTDIMLGCVLHVQRVSRYNIDGQRSRGASVPRFTVCKINVIGALQDPDPDPTNYSKVADFITPI